MEMELARADSELEYLLSQFDKTEQEFCDSSLDFWKKHKLKKDLRELVDQINAWQCYRYEICERLEMLKKLQDMMQSSVVKPRAPEAGNHQRVLEEKMKQAEIDIMLKKQQVRPEADLRTTMQKQPQIETLSHEEQLHNLDSFILNQEGEVIDATKVFDELSNKNLMGDYEVNISPFKFNSYCLPKQYPGMNIWPTGVGTLLKFIYVVRAKVTIVIFGSDNLVSRSSLWMEHDYGSVVHHAHVVCSVIQFSDVVVGVDDNTNIVVAKFEGEFVFAEYVKDISSFHTYIAEDYFSIDDWDEDLFNQSDLRGLFIYKTDREDKSLFIPGKYVLQYAVMYDQNVVLREVLGFPETKFKLKFWSDDPVKVHKGFTNIWPNMARKKLYMFWSTIYSYSMVIQISHKYGSCMEALEMWKSLKDSIFKFTLLQCTVVIEPCGKNGLELHTVIMNFVQLIPYAVQSDEFNVINAFSTCTTTYESELECYGYLVILTEFITVASDQPWRLLGIEKVDVQCWDDSGLIAMSTDVVNYIKSEHGTVKPFNYNLCNIGVIIIFEDGWLGRHTPGSTHNSSSSLESIITATKLNQHEKQQWCCKGNILQEVQTLFLDGPTNTSYEKFLEYIDELFEEVTTKVKNGIGTTEQVVDAKRIHKLVVQMCLAGCMGLTFLTEFITLDIDPLLELILAKRISHVSYNHATATEILHAFGVVLNSLGMVVSIGNNTVFETHYVPRNYFLLPRAIHMYFQVRSTCDNNFCFWPIGIGTMLCIEDFMRSSNGDIELSYHMISTSRFMSWSNSYSLFAPTVTQRPSGYDVKGNRLPTLLVMFGVSQRQSELEVLEHMFFQSIQIPKNSYVEPFVGTMDFISKVVFQCQYISEAVRVIAVMLTESGFVASPSMLEFSSTPENTWIEPAVIECEAEFVIKLIKVLPSEFLFGGNVSTSTKLLGVNEQYIYSCHGSSVIYIFMWMLSIHCLALTTSHTFSRMLAGGRVTTKPTVWDRRLALRVHLNGKLFSVDFEYSSLVVWEDVGEQFIFQYESFTVDHVVAKIISVTSCDIAYTIRHIYEEGLSKFCTLQLYEWESSIPNFEAFANAMNCAARRKTLQTLKGSTMGMFSILKILFLPSVIMFDNSSDTYQAEFYCGESSPDVNWTSTWEIILAVDYGCPQKGLIFSSILQLVRCGHYILLKAFRIAKFEVNFCYHYIKYANQNTVGTLMAKVLVKVECARYYPTYAILEDKNVLKKRVVIWVFYVEIVIGL